MIRYRTIVCVALLGLASTMAIAHPNHDEDVTAMTANDVAELADKSLPEVIKTKKLKTQWAKGERQSVAKRDVAGKEVWVVIYKNPDAQGADALLYVFFDGEGNFVDANHTGKLAG